MNEDLNKNIVSSWIMLQGIEQGTSAANSLMWAAEVMIEKAISQPHECWKLIMDIANSTDDEWILANVASGPLETLLATHPYEAIELVESAAAKNRKVVRMVNCVWRNAIPEDVWHRLQSLK